jgi:hypothetical protein
MGTHLSSQATWKAEIMRTGIPDQPWQKSFQNPISVEKKLSVGAHTCHSRDDKKHVQVGQSKKQDLISKITREKKAVGVAQAVECLSHKC